MSSKASAGGPYEGALGQTTTAATTILCSGCDTWYGARYHTSIRLEGEAAPGAEFLRDGFSVANRAECPHCGALYVIEEPVVVHDVGGGRLFLVVPDGQRHRLQQARAALLVSLATEEKETAPVWIFDPQTVVGVGGLRRALRAATAAPFPVPEPEPVRLNPPSEAPAAAASVSVELSVDAEQSSDEAVTSVSAPAAANLGSAPRAMPTVPIARAASAPMPVLPAATPRTGLQGVARAIAAGGNRLPAPPEKPTVPNLPVVGATTVPAPAAPAMTAAPPAPLPASVPLVSPERETLDASVDVAIESVDGSVDGAFTSAGPGVESSTQVKSRGTSEPRTAGLLMEALGRRAESPVNPAPASEPAARAWDASLDAGWALEAAEAPANEDPTHVVRAEDLELPPKRPTGPIFDEARGGGRDTYARLDGSRVQAVVRLSAARANAFHGGDAGFGVQLHQTAAGPVLNLLLVYREEGEAIDHVAWVLEPDAPGLQPVLDALLRDFVVDVIFHLPDGAFHGRRTFNEPLAANLRTGIDIWRAGRNTDRAAARRLFEAPEYDRVGRLKHNFHGESFQEIRSAAEARLALGILSYWSAPERRDYLLRIKSFPETLLEVLNRRVLQGALDYGLCMEPHLRQRTLDLKLVESSPALVKMALANFAEVCLNLKPNDLDPLDTWDNWESLLALADELDVHVDEEIEELASLAMERAREAAQAGESQEMAADDAGIEMVEVGELGSMSSPAVCTLLGNPDLRTEAALALLHRGDTGYALSVFDAMRRMTRDQLERVVPAALAMGPAFEGAFVGALRSKRASLRIAAAFFLAEIRSERSVIPLLDLTLNGPADEWQFLARAAARLGRRIVNPAVRLVHQEGDADGRIAFTLALLGTETRGALSAALDRETDGRVQACLNRAIDRAAAVSFADPADFSERLADAFQSCRSDAVGPDFDEDLESIDIGPAASVKDLETDVDLDGMDDPKGR